MSKNILKKLKITFFYTVEFQFFFTYFGAIVDFSTTNKF